MSVERIGLRPSNKWGLLGSSESACKVGNLGLMPGSGEGNDYPLQYSCLENSMDRGAWQATVHGVMKRTDWATDTYMLVTSKLHLKTRHFLVVQELRLWLPMQGAQVPSLVRELRSHVLQSVAKNKGKKKKRSDREGGAPLSVPSFIYSFILSRIFNDSLLYVSHFYRWYWI